MKALDTAGTLLAASRPVSWINTAFPYAAAYLLTTKQIDATLIVGTFFFLIPYNLAMYGINDVFDYESDVINARKGGVEGGVADRSAHGAIVVAIIATNLPLVVWLLLNSNTTAQIALCVSLFLVFAYSLPILRFKELPVIDSVTSSLHFVSPAIVGLSMAGLGVAEWNHAVLIAFFAWGAATHAFGAIQDIQPDRAAGIGSIATRFGARATLLVCLGLWLFSSAVLLVGPWPLQLASPLPLIYVALAARHAKVTDTTSAATNKTWRRVMATNYFVGFLVTMIMIYTTMQARA